jgi:hypothetical protein
VGKKLLVIFGVAAVAGYLFRDQVAAFVVDLGARINQIKMAQDDTTWTVEEEDK